jgi:hypothetical protein
LELSLGNRTPLLHQYLIDEDYANVIGLCQSALNSGTLAEDDQAFLGLIELLQSNLETLKPSEADLILELLQQILELYPHHPEAPNFAVSCISRLPQKNAEIFRILLSKTIFLLSPLLVISQSPKCIELLLMTMRIQYRTASNYLLIVSRMSFSTLPNILIQLLKHTGYDLKIDT